MKRFLFAIMALAASAGLVSAADLPARTAAPAPVYAVAPVFSWSGFYVGANAGYATGRTDVNQYGLDFTTDGWLAGVTLGAQRDFGTFVVGIEGDLNFAQVDTSKTFYGITASGEMNYFGTLRARVGFPIFADRRLMPYVTGGLFWQNVKASVVVPNYASASSEESAIGWTVGAGLEYAITGNWSLKGEYLYARTDIDHRFTGGGLGGGIGGGQYFGQAIATQNNLHIVRAGVNYRF